MGLASIGGILAGAYVDLPLFEFHDVIAVESGLAVTMATATPNIRAAPGSHVVWNANITGPDGVRLHVYPIGSSIDLVHYDGAREVDSKATVQVAMNVPSDARDGDLLEFILVAEGTHDPSIAGGLRLSVAVDQKAPLIQDKVQESHQSPIGLEAFLALALAALVAVKRQR